MMILSWKNFRMKSMLQFSGIMTDNFFNRINSNLIDSDEDNDYDPLFGDRGDHVQGNQVVNDDGWHNGFQYYEGDCLIYFSPVGILAQQK